MNNDDVTLEVDDEFLFYSVIYSTITLSFGMAVLTKFLTNEFRFGLRSALSLAVLFIGEPVCHLLLKGPSGVICFGLSCLLIYSLLPASHLSAAGKAVLITGCDSGFGHALAKKLDSIGMDVFAGCLNINGSGANDLQHSCSERLHILQLDVTKQHQINAVFDYINSRITPEIGLWGLVNNAGLFCVADIEMTSQPVIDTIFDVNFHGMVRTVRTFLPLIHNSNGRIVNMSSFTGRVPMEHFGAYAASKYAIEGYSDVLRLEMKKYGIHVSIIEPGAFKTNLISTVLNERKEEIWRNCPPSVQAAYGRQYLDNLYSNFEKEMSSSPNDVTPVVRAYRSALLSKRPRERYPCGSLVETILTVFPIIPTWVSDKLCHSLALSRYLLPAACLQRHP